MINKVYLVGRLGQEPESRKTTAGLDVANLRLATTSKRNGESQTEWHSIVCFGKVAENVVKYTHKGSLIAIDGKIQTKEFEDRQGQKRSKTEILANEVTFLDSKKDLPEPTAKAVVEVSTGDDDFPF